ncbi:MAG: hypothetical protein NVS9B15_04780 [Acidobacteriaceae bacterium]
MSLCREDLEVGKLYVVSPPENRRRQYRCPWWTGTDNLPVLVVDLTNRYMVNLPRQRWADLSERVEIAARGRHVGVLAPARPPRENNRNYNQRPVTLTDFREYVPTAFMPKDFVGTWEEAEARQVQTIYEQAQRAQRWEETKQANIAVHGEILATLPYFGATEQQMGAFSTQASNLSMGQDQPSVNFPLHLLAKIVAAGISSIRGSAILDLDN